MKPNILGKILENTSVHYFGYNENLMKSVMLKNISKTMKILQNISVCLLLGMLLALPTLATAQVSFKEVEKMRKEEEKRRAKLAKEEAKKQGKQPQKSNVNENNTWQDDKGKSKAKARKNSGRGRGKKQKGNVTKAAQGLSQQRRSSTANTEKYRKGNAGLTKSAKAQRKLAKRTKKGTAIEVW